MKTKNAQIRIGEAFNECPGHDAIVEALDKALGRLGYKFVDVPKEEVYMGTWQNNEDTLVFQVTGAASTSRGIKIGKLAMELGADELHSEHNESGKVIVRLWWD